MRSFSVATDFVPAGPKKQGTKILKSLEILDKIDPKYTNIYAPNIIDRYENCPDNLDDFCLPHFVATYIREEANMNQIDTIKNIAKNLFWRFTRRKI